MHACLHVTGQVPLLRGVGAASWCPGASSHPELKHFHTAVMAWAVFVVPPLGGNELRVNTGPEVR